MSTKMNHFSSKATPYVEKDTGLPSMPIPNQITGQETSVDKLAINSKDNIIYKE
jgi:hypothetical protein